MPSNTFTRQELYSLVWSEPMTSLAARLEISSTALAKHCKKADIPRPPMGHWAKLNAGKKVTRQSLPARGPGMSDEVAIGAHQYWGYRQTSDEEILKSDPRPPVFEDELSDVEKRVKSMVRKVTVATTLDKPHRKIRKLLDEDEARRVEAEKSTYTFSWDKPRFDEPIEQRRLSILNAIFTALEQCVMRPDVGSGGEARRLSVKVNDWDVPFWLDATSQKDEDRDGNKIATRGDSSKLKLVINPPYRATYEAQSWEDAGRARLENKVKQIVIALIVEAERRYRLSEQRHYEWLVKSKAELIEKIRKRKEEAEQQERERLAQLEKDRIQKLLDDADDLRRSADIRAYVSAVQARCESADISVEESELENWCIWALAQADRIDPVLSGSFLKQTHKEENHEPAEG